MQIENLSSLSLHFWGSNAHLLCFDVNEAVAQQWVQSAVRIGSSVVRFSLCGAISPEEGRFMHPSVCHWVFQWVCICFHTHPKGWQFLIRSVIWDELQELWRWWWTGEPGVLQSMGSQSRTWLSDWMATTGAAWVWLKISPVYMFILWVRVFNHPPEMQITL